MAEGSGGGAKAALLAALVVTAAVAVVVADEGTPAGASELATFSSCEELTAWMADAGGAGGSAGDDMATTFRARDGDVAEEAASPAAPPALAASPAAGASMPDSGTGATNVIVEGIDELDRVEQLDGGRVLAVGERSLHLVDVGAARSLSSIPVPLDAQVSYDAERSQLWIAGSDGARTEVVRARLDGDALAVDGTWSSDGMLLSGRRGPDGFHVVLTQGFGGAVPFREGPVPCAEVLHPTGPAAPEATMLVNLPPDGAVEPVAATEIVGAGRFVHLTSEEVIVATPLWEAEPATSLHRFELGSLTHTGSGRVAGSLLNEFALSLHDGFLRVAVTHDGGGLVIVDDEAVIEPGIDPVEPGPIPVEPGPIPVDPGIGGPAGPPQPPDRPADPLNEVVVLDTVGELDVVGRSSRFGLPGETLHGIRFVGTTAYAVTFLQTDPFYVLDLADPAAPRVVGEVKLPGFSSYLHPVAEGLVVGFGPDDDGQVAAKLFDVSDPTAPAVVDSVALGQESAVAWDHHAFLGLGDGRFAVPAITAWEPVDPVGCTPERRSELEQQAIALEQQLAEATDQAQSDALLADLERLWSDPCRNTITRPVTTIVELQVAGGALQEVSRTEVRSRNPGERVLRFDDRWALWSSSELVVVPDAGGEVSVPLT